MLMLMKTLLPVKINNGKSLEERIEDQRDVGLIKFVNDNIVSGKFICVDTKNTHINCYTFGEPMSHSMVCEWLKENKPNMGLGTIFHLLAWHEMFPNRAIENETILAPGTLWYKDPTWYFNKVIEYMPAVVYIGGRVGLDIRPIKDTTRDCERDKVYPEGTGWIVCNRKMAEKNGRNRLQKRG